MSFSNLKHWHRLALAGLVLAVLYGINFFDCATSAVIQFPFVFEDADMHANLCWAKTIQDQGWLNPHPYHPFNSWMPSIGTPEEWTRWWGGDAIFQQSPLYAYFLSVMLWLNGNVIYVHLVQSLLGMGLCVLTGLVARRVANDSRVGWVAFWLAAFYSPYYVYSWSLLRDILAWVITAGLLLLLVEMDEVAPNKPRKYLMMGAAGLLMGIGYLARETFMLIIPPVLVVLAVQAVCRRSYAPLCVLVCGLVAALSPLLIRNLEVGAPPLSSSNRFAEGFILGNVASALPNQFTIPPEMHAILEKTGGQHGKVIVETLKSHPNSWSFFRLQTLKLLSLFDPFEPSDNVSIYFMQNISAPVRWGLQHWMIIVPGVGGLILSLRSKNRRHFWLWLMFVPLLAGVLVGTPMSRYRQSLVILWIPWAALFLVTLWQAFSQNRRAAWGMALAAVLGWAACLTVLARTPRNQYERPAEYLFAIKVYGDAGQFDKMAEMKQLLHQKFPEQYP